MQTVNDIQTTCLNLASSGKDLEYIYTNVYSKERNASFESFKRLFRMWKVRAADKKNEKPFVLLEELKKGVDIRQLPSLLKTDSVGCAKILVDLHDQGYNLLQLGNEIKLSTIVVPQDNHVDGKWSGEKIIRFGMISDTHLNSKYTQITHLHAYYDLCQREGITTVYHAGDIDEGEQMRTGHQYECYEQGADDHVDHIVKVYPQRSGIHTEFITGNHDASIIKRCGYDIGKPISQRRDDMTYLGQSNAIIALAPNCTMEIRHPLDGSSSYALSYKLQKMIDSITGGEKPHILAVGHYHKTEYLLYRNIHAFQTGCFQAQTDFMKGKGLSASLGGWIIEIHVNDEGSIERIRPTFFPFYKAIQDDYKNWI